MARAFAPPSWSSQPNVEKPLLDGSPRFNPNEAGPVVVDPDEPGGGWSLDYRQLTNDSIRLALQDAANAEEVFTNLRKIMQQQPPPAPPVAATSPAESPAPVGTPNREPQSPQLEAVLAQLVQRLTPAAPSPPARVDEPAASWASLKMPFLTGKPQKAQRQVYFELPHFGKQLARYHEVIESEHCVVLVYDTRYEDGTEYLPPDWGEQAIVLHVPHLHRTFTVASMGLHYACGALDFVVLIKQQAEPLTYRSEGASA
jgi:hypothetical protein